MICLANWVAIHYSKCDYEDISHYRKHIKDNTGFYLFFGGLWYEGDANTSKPYGKSNGQLKKRNVWKYMHRG